MKSYNIYLYQFEDGKCYVGRTKSFSKRCSAGHYKANKKLYNAMQNQNYDLVIIAVAFNLKEARELENYYILHYNCIENGYNKYLNRII